MYFLTDYNPDLNLFDWSLKIYVNSVLNTKVEKQQF